MKDAARRGRPPRSLRDPRPLGAGGIGEVFRVGLRTGRRELVREITPADRSGIGVLGGVAVRPSANGKSYIYGFHQILSDLYLIEGLR